MTKYDKEFQSNTPEFEEARKPLEGETREPQRGDVKEHGFEDVDAPKERRDEEK